MTSLLNVTRCYRRSSRSLSHFGMTNWARYPACCLLLITMLAITPATAKENATELAKQANVALQAGDVETAIQRYEAASALSSDPRITYNKAIAHYRKGEIDTARGLFASVIGDRNQKLVAKARYNMGNADYAEAVHFAGEDDSTTAVAKLRSAIDHYRSALTIDRKDADARANIELAHRLLRQLERQEQQQDQQQQKDQNQQNSESEDSQDQQQESTNQDSEEDSQDQQQQDQQQQKQQQQEEKSEDQQSESQPQNDQEDQNEDQQNQGQTDQDQQSDESSQQNEPSNEKSQQQDSQQQPSNETQPNEDVESDDKSTQATDDSDQAPPEGELKPMNQQAETNPNGQPQDFKEGQKMTMEEARKMLQAVRDRNLRRRLQKLRQTRARQIPVEKDW